MRISDWSSDVCSSDLITLRRSTPDLADVTRRNEFGQQPTVVHVSMRHDHGIDFARPERKRTMVEPFQATRTLKQPTVDQKPTLAIRDFHTRTGHFAPSAMTCERNRLFRVHHRPSIEYQRDGPSAPDRKSTRLNSSH